MKLKHIINALRTEKIHLLLDKYSLLPTDLSNINVYAEYSICGTNNYCFFQNTDYSDTYIILDDIGYQKLCDLSTLQKLIHRFLREQPDRANDVLEIVIIDHILSLRD